VNKQIFWYTARATGIVSWGLLSTSVLVGVVLSTRLLGKRAAPAWLLDLHRFLGGAACMFVSVHIGGLVADNYLHFGPSEILVPLASTWHPVAVAWGVVSLYLLVAIETTSLLKRRLPSRVWRKVHGTSFVLWLLSTVHGFSSGTDSSNRLYQWVGLAIGLAVVYTVTVRMLSPRPDRPDRAERPRVPPRTPVTASSAP
jgi:DMSO/TMAO reductase YedYZ heme-binding membrane subunit